ncbi:MAG: P-loop NTPase fold protein [Pseudomonadota bacterium]
MAEHGFLNDEWTLEDDLGHAEHVRRLGEMVRTCQTPYVIGVHGDWGVGKTSFLRKLHLFISGKDCDYNKAAEIRTGLWDDASCNSNPIESVWFEAWRYQYEANPVAALLDEIRFHFTWTGKLTGKAAKLTYSALMSVGELTKKIGISPRDIVSAGEKWEHDHLLGPVPSKLYRELLDDAVKKLLDGRKKKRLVIFVDDLDRCRADVAFSFLEAIKVYLSLTNCVFVLALDVRNVRRAVAKELTNRGLIPDEEKIKPDLHAAAYLGKLFQSVYYLPALTDPAGYFGKLVKKYVAEQNDSRWEELVREHKLLPPNPRKIKFFVNGLSLFLTQLEPVLGKANRTLDHHLVLILTYLKLMANDLYRILESDQTYWALLVEFCRNPRREKLHSSLENIPTLEVVTSPDGEVDFKYGPSYIDPANEGLFRAASLIREWQGGRELSDLEWSIYFLRGGNAA